VRIIHHGQIKSSTRHPDCDRRCVVSALTVGLTDEQSNRLEEICDASGFSPDMQIGAMIDLDYEELEDMIASTSPTTRSTRFARFVLSEKGGVS
jgi:hypothetical protein